MLDDANLIVTDTATICIFDLAAMAHRKDDVGDWWSLWQNREVEIKDGNALFLNVGDDGAYRIEVTQREGISLPGYCLATPSGIIFIGPGEEMSGGGFEPDGKWGGFFFAVNAPHQKVSISRDGNAISVNLQASQPFENEPIESIHL
ncbi:DUF6386 family protein [Sphingomonas sp.]|uniref:DUF6386 family protein n=1 Tax=Sphingomonas sp. TaxID=28214 RepID=UPI0025DC27F1|nr:DUF6386 family protein [Sphingomonas sp.]